MLTYLCAALLLVSVYGRVVRYTDVAGESEGSSFKRIGERGELGTRTIWGGNTLVNKDNVIIGHSSGICTVVSDAEGADILANHCQYTHVFVKDNGSMTFSGLQKNGPAVGKTSVNHIAVVGGTGPFSGVEADAVMTEHEDPTKFEFVVKID